MRIWSARHSFAEIRWNDGKSAKPRKDVFSLSGDNSSGCNDHADFSRKTRSQDAELPFYLDQGTVCAKGRTALQTSSYRNDWSDCERSDMVGRHRIRGNFTSVQLVRRFPPRIHVIFPESLGAWCSIPCHPWSCPLGLDTDARQVLPWKIRITLERPSQEGMIIRLPVTTDYSFVIQHPLTDLRLGWSEEGICPILHSHIHLRRQALHEFIVPCFELVHLLQHSHPLLYPHRRQRSGYESAVTGYLGALGQRQDYPMDFYPLAVRFSTMLIGFTRFEPLFPRWRSGNSGGF